TVVAMDNTPLAGVQLGLARPRTSPGEDPTFAGSLISTRDNGEFRFLANHPPGRYELLALTQRGPVSVLDGQTIEFDPKKPLTNFMFHLAPLKKGRWRSFGTAQGLPQAHVHGIWPVPDGTLWVASDEGLARFNGQEFIPWELPPSLHGVTFIDFQPDRQGM